MIMKIKREKITLFPEVTKTSHAECLTGQSMGSTPVWCFLNK